MKFWSILNTSLNKEREKKSDCHADFCFTFHMYDQVFARDTHHINKFM